MALDAHRAVPEAIGTFETRGYTFLALVADAPMGADGGRSHTCILASNGLNTRYEGYRIGAKRYLMRDMTEVDIEAFNRGLDAIHESEERFKRFQRERVKRRPAPATGQSIKIPNIANLTLSND